jgi:hypothetical protein
MTSSHPITFTVWCVRSNGSSNSIYEGVIVTQTSKIYEINIDGSNELEIELPMEWLQNGWSAKRIQNMVVSTVLECW